MGDGAGEDGLPQPADGGEEQGSEEVGEVYRDASLRVLFATLPPVLTLHLKVWPPPPPPLRRAAADFSPAALCLQRFSRAMDGFLSKYTGHVTFPLELDMAPYCLRGASSLPPPPPWLPLRLTVAAHALHERREA